MVGSRPGELFTRWRAIWRNTMDVRAACDEAYTYKDQACIMPILDIGDVVILPSSEAQWFADVPQSRMSAHQNQMNSFQLLHTIEDPRLVREEHPIHEVLIAGILTRETKSLLPSMIRSMSREVDVVLGCQPGATTKVTLMTGIPQIISRMVNCAFLGPSLSSTPGIIEAAMNNAQGIGMSCLILRCSPQVLRPILGPLLTWPHKIESRKFYKMVGPEVRQRLAIAMSQGGYGETREKSQKGDYMQWLIEAAVESGDPYMMKPETIMGRILLVNFVAVHVSSMVIVNCILDLAASEPTNIDSLRKEIVAGLEQSSSKFNKQALNLMPKLDSTFRESQRLHSINTVASPRPVIDPEGITTPSGVHIPYGMTAGVLSYPVLHDPATYQDPMSFKPFRFAESKALAGSNSESLRQNWISVTSTYTPWGTVKHACPGRFFAANMLKVALAYILLHYDIVPITERPQSVLISVAIIPSGKAALEFQRREVPLYDWDTVELSN